MTGKGEQGVCTQVWRVGGGALTGSGGRGGVGTGQSTGLGIWGLGQEP